MAAPADMEQAIENIRKATKGFGTNEKLLMDTLINISPDRLMQLQAHYKANYGRSLEDLIHSETSGQFGKLLAMLCVPEPILAADLLHKAMSGVGCNEELMVETLIGRTNAEINAIKAAYQERYGKNLEEKIKSEVKGDVKKFFVCLLQACRDEAGQYNNVESDAESFYKAGEGKFGTDETEFIRLLVNRQDKHLQKVFDAYAHKHGRMMDKVIKKEFSGKIEITLIDLVKMIENRAEYFATVFESTMHGIGTNEDKLHRFLCRFRRTPFMNEIKEAYLKKYGKTLELRIKGETSGEHEKLCVSLLQ